MTENNRCPNCGAELQENARFCIRCMTSLDVKREIPKEKERKSKKFRTVIACVSAVALITVAICICVVIYLNSRVAPICTAEDFLSRVPAANQHLGTDELWDAGDFKDIRHSAVDNTVEYSTDLKFGDSLISVFFHNGGEVVSAAVWDVEQEDIDKAMDVLICVTDSVCGNYFTDINDVFKDDRQYPRSNLDKPFEEYFTDFVRRTDDYNRFIADGGSISSRYIGMDADGLYIVLYVTERSNAEKTLYDLTVYIEKR